MKAVIFDMDGLMFDTERVFMKAWDYAGEKIGVGKAGYMVLKTLGVNASAVKEIWRKEFGEYDEKTLNRYTQSFLTEYYEKNGVPVKKGLYNLLDYLKESGYKMAVASSTASCEVEKRLKMTGISDYFSAVIGGDMTAKSKPEPDIYLKACEIIGAMPQQSYALEDSKNGLLSAYRAGLKPIMIPDLWQSDEEFDKILCAKFTNLDEAKEYFMALNLE